MDLVRPPNDPELRNIIDKLANFVARNGAEFEEMTKNKQRDNQKFSFLFGGEHYPYYRKRVNDEYFNIHQNSINNAPWQQPMMPLPPQPPSIFNNNSQTSSINNIPLPNITPNFRPSNDIAPPFLNQSSQFYSFQYNNQTAYNQNFIPNRTFEYLQKTGLNNMSLEKIKISEENLEKYYQDFAFQQQTNAENIIIESQNKKIINLSQGCNIDIGEIEAILKPIKDTCTKESISNGKNWILKNNINSFFPEFFGRYIIKQIMNVETKFDTRLHIIYLINDLMHHCVRKNVQELRDALENTIIPIFCQTYIFANLSEREKLDKLLKLWENNNYFKPDYLEDLKRPEQALSQYKSDLIAEYHGFIDPMRQDFDQRYQQLKSQHEVMVDNLVNNPQNYGNTQIDNNNYTDPARYFPPQEDQYENYSNRMSPIRRDEYQNITKPQSLLGDPPPSSMQNQQTPVFPPDFNSMPFPPPPNPAMLKEFMNRMNNFSSNSDNSIGNNSAQNNPMMSTLMNFVQNSNTPNNNMPGGPGLPPQMMMLMFNLMKNFSAPQQGSNNMFPPNGPNPMMAMFNMMNAANAGGTGGPPPMMFAMMKKFMETFNKPMGSSNLVLPNMSTISSPTSSSTSQLLLPPDMSDKTIIPTLPYFDLPAGLMVQLLKDEDIEYQLLDPKDLRLPAPDPPSEQLINAVEAFYSQPTHETPRNSEGWEHLGLFEFYKVKAKYKKAAATAMEDKSNRDVDSRRSRSRSGSMDRRSGSRNRKSRSPYSRSASSSRSSRSLSPRKGDREDNTLNKSEFLNGDTKNDSEMKSAKKKRSKARKKSKRERSNSRSRTPKEVRKKRKKEKAKRIFKEIASDEENKDARPRSLSKEGSRRRSSRRSRSRNRCNSKSRSRSTSPMSPSPFPSYPVSDDTFAIKDVSEQQRLEDDNIGHQLLKKMGWKGAGLGLNEQGTQDPISGGEVRETSRKYEGMGVAKTREEMKAFENYRKVRCKALYNR